MGNETKCAARIAGKRHEGRALLETNELIFRGPECRLKIWFGEIRGITATEGELRIKTRDGTTVFEVGEIAQKWREKILHPKTRIEKLGVKAGTRIAVLGNAEPAFLAELRQSRVDISRPRLEDDTELIFLFVENQRGLADVGKVAKKLKGDAGLWVAYRKGRKEVSEVDVIGAGRKAGLKDVKVVGFSPTHTALKFVIPLAER
jgi:hypothetical protein